MESKKCPLCDKVVEGYTENQVETMMQQHLLNKHSDKVKLVIKK